MNPISWLKLIYNQVLVILNLLSRGLRFTEELSNRLTTDEIQLQRIESKLDQTIQKLQRLLDLEEILEGLVIDLQDLLSTTPAASLSAELGPVTEQPSPDQATSLEGSLSPTKTPQRSITKPLGPKPLAPGKPPP